MVAVGRRLSALELVGVALDDGSFVRWDIEPVTVVADEVYAAELDRARERSGLDEAVITGEGMIRGRRVALIACEFAFLAGSIGVAAAEILTICRKATVPSCMRVPP